MERRRKGKKKETEWDDKDTVGTKPKLVLGFRGQEGAVNALSQWGRIIVGRGKDGVTRVDKTCDVALRWFPVYQIKGLDAKSSEVLEGRSGDRDREIEIAGQ